MSFLTNSSCRTDDSTPFLTLSAWAFIMLPILAVQDWGRAGVTAVVKDRTGQSEVQGANRLCAAPGVTVTIHTDIRKSWFSFYFYTKDGFIFWYVSHVFNILMVSGSSPKRISGSWWHRNFSFRYLPAHWIQSHGQIYTQINTHTVPEIPRRDGLHGQNFYPQKIS